MSNCPILFLFALAVFAAGCHAPESQTETYDIVLSAADVIDVESGTLLKIS